MLTAVLAMLLVFGVTSGFIMAVKKKKKSEEAAGLKSILFVGDSFTAGSPNYSYSYIIKNTLTDNVVDIVAMSSQKTDWMLANLQSQLAQKHYDRVYIWGRDQ